MEAVAIDVPAKPLEVTDEDAEELRSYFDGREEDARAGDLLTQIFEIRPGKHIRRRCGHADGLPAKQA